MWTLAAQPFRYAPPCLPRATQRRGDHSCVRLPASSEVFCIGGFTETEFDFSILKSVERFDIETEEWETKAAMVNPRADFGAG